MTLKSYDGSYLPYVSENLGAMLEYAVNCGYRAQTFWNMFANSYVAKQIENGNPRFLIGCSAIDLFNYVIRAVESDGAITPTRSFTSRSRFFWSGWVLAQYQHYSGLSFSAINSVLPLNRVLELYDTLHEADIYKFFQVADSYVRRYKTETNLAKMRKIAGLSQMQLAKRANISVRSIQSYEQGDNDINKAQAIIVFRIARVLGCSVEDLLEYN